MVDYKELYFTLLRDMDELRNTIDRIEDKCEKIRHYLEDGEKSKEALYYPRTKKTYNLKLDQM